MTEADWSMLNAEVPPLLQAGRLVEAQALVRQAVRQGLQRQLAPNRLACNLVVTGPPRIGKSELVAEIVDRTGALVASLDRLRLLYNGDDDPARREAGRRAVVEAALGAAPRGIIVEGDDLISENRARRGGMEPFSLQRLAEWQARRLARVIIVGCPEITVEEKLAGLKTWRATGQCWTAWHPVYAQEAELPGLAYGLVTSSQRLRDMADAAGLFFLPLSHGGFVQEIICAAAALSAQPQRAVTS